MMTTLGIQLSKFSKRIGELRVPSSASSRLNTVSRASRSSWDGTGDNVEQNDQITNWPPADVPQGCLAVYVGCKRQRFVIKVQHLNHPNLKPLLDKSAEEFGFQHKGGLIIPCEPMLFEQLLMLLSNDDSFAWRSTSTNLLQPHEEGTVAHPTVELKYSQN